MSGTSTPTLTPGLTLGQRRQLADALERVGGVPVGLLALIFMDVDRSAAQVFDARFAVRAARRGERDAIPRADEVAMSVASEHAASRGAVAFTYGCAIGLRLGRQFWPRSLRPQRYLSDDYRRLDRNQKDRVTRFIRALLRGDEPRHVPGPKPGSQRATVAEDLVAIRRWKREAGERVRAEARR